MISKPIALISVYDKTNIVEFSRNLILAGYQILSTGGTSKLLKKHGIPIRLISDYTREPEMFSGRVKTMHPKIIGGILFDRKNKDHIKDKNEFSIENIDIVVCNFYPFNTEVVQQKKDLVEGIEFIDIGGPCLLRAAAKNWQSCLAVSSYNEYEKISDKILKNEVCEEFRKNQANKAFKKVLEYDLSISNYFHSCCQIEEKFFSNDIVLDLKKDTSLRYGENPHQQGALYITSDSKSKIYNQIQGKQLSYNNFLDLDAGYQLVKDFNSHPCFIILKHTNPCGVSFSNKLAPLDLYLKALQAEPEAAFGGVVCTNQLIDKSIAQEICKTFFECICAPEFSNDAIEFLKNKRNLRVIEIPDLKTKTTLRSKLIQSTSFGYLVQENICGIKDKTKWNLVSGKYFSSQEIEQLYFTMVIAKHAKSNAIIIVKNGHTIGVGAGHMSRIDASKHAIQKAMSFGFDCRGAVVASDAFFPFADCIEYFSKFGISGIVQPGGSIRDQESIDMASKHNITMYFTGERYFKH